MPHSFDARGAGGFACLVWAQRLGRPNGLPHRGLAQKLCGISLQASAQPLRRFRENLEVAQDGILNQPAPEKNSFAPMAILLDALDAFQHVLDVEPVFSHRGTASLTTRSRIRRRRPLSSTMSTLRPSSSSRSARNPPGKNGVRFGPASINRSKSLSARASPRAKEPNTRMLITPCLAAIARIASRLADRSSSSVTGSPLDATYFSTTAQSQLCGAGPLTRSRPPGRPSCGDPGSPPGGGLAVQGDRPTKSKCHRLSAVDVSKL